MSFDDSNDLNEILEDLRAENEKLQHENSRLSSNLESLSVEFCSYKHKFEVESKMLEIYGPVMMKNFVAEYEAEKQSGEEKLIFEQLQTLEISSNAMTAQDSDYNLKAEFESA